MHAVLAVSSYHAGRQVSRDDYSLVNIVNHQNTAIKLYDEEIINFTMSKWPQLLDTTMLLFMFKVSRPAQFYPFMYQHYIRQHNLRLAIGKPLFPMPCAFSNYQEGHNFGQITGKSKHKLSYFCGT